MGVVIGLEGFMGVVIGLEGFLGVVTGLKGFFVGVTKVVVKLGHIAAQTEPRCMHQWEQGCYLLCLKLHLQHDAQ